MFGVSTKAIPWLWFHLACYSIPHQILLVTDIEGFEDLKEADQASLIELFETASESLAFGKLGPSGKGNNHFFFFFFFFFSQSPGGTSRH